MKNWPKHYAVVFFAGFSLLVLTLGLGAIQNNFLSPNTLLFALRSLAAGLMATGAVMWVMFNREASGKPGLSPLLGFIAVVSVLVLILPLIVDLDDSERLLSQMGMWGAIVAAGLGMLLMVVDPAFPKPITTLWPEGGEPVFESHDQPPHHKIHEETASQSASREPDTISPGTLASPVGTTQDLSAEDDLTRIEGIGPKVQGILKAAGVRTYAMLSSKTSEQIAEIVKSGGFKTPFNPETWPHQASLAGAGDWDSLKKLQDELNAGRS